MFCGFARLLEHTSFLDVGAGTGRGARFIKECFPDAHVAGVEPVEALRTAAKQIDPLEGIELFDGDAQSLAFEVNSFDWVIETGVLHHIPDFKKATEEMCRVAKVGVLISDANNIGQGRAPVRTLKRVIKGVGLWKPFVFLHTRGKCTSRVRETVFFIVFAHSIA